MRGANPRAAWHGLIGCVAVLLAMLAVAPLCSATPPRHPHRQPTLRQAAAASREIAEVSTSSAIVPPARCGALEAPAAIGWLPPSGEPASLSVLHFPALHTRAPPAR